MANNVTFMLTFLQKEYIISYDHLLYFHPSSKCLSMLLTL